MLPSNRRHLQRSSRAGSRATATTILAIILPLWLCPWPGDSCSASNAAAGPPRRIVSLGPINTENLYLLGVGDRLVGNTRYCVRPRAAKGIAKVGTVTQFSLEKVISLKPDLVLATGLTNAQQVAQLKRLGLRVTRFDQPKSLAESCDHFLQLGALLQREATAKTLIEKVWQRVAAIQAAVSEFQRPKVFLQIGLHPLHGAAPDSFTHDFIRLAGAENILGAERSGKTHLEKVISHDPDLILIAIMGSESGIAGKEKRKWFELAEIKAARSGRIHIVDPDLVCSSSPVTFVDALEIIAKLIHPALQLRSPLPES